MRINAITQPVKAELRKIEASRKTDKESKNIKISDRSDISSGAQSLNETKAQSDTIAASLSSLPDIRNEKIAEVRSKIENGYYNSDEFLEKLAERLLNEFGIKNGWYRVLFKLCQLSSNCHLPPFSLNLSFFLF